MWKKLALVKTKKLNMLIQLYVIVYIIYFPPIIQLYIAFYFLK